MPNHSQLSPSKRHRWAVCPASVREAAKYPESRSGAAAIDGTHTHTLLDLCIKNSMSPRHYVGQTLTDHDGEFQVDEARAERVEFALNYIFQRRIEMGLDSLLFSEMQVDPQPIFDRSDLSGHIDVQIVGDSHLEIIDYKDGFNVVDAVQNPQLLQYAFGALCAHQSHIFKTITLTIIQPKLREKGLSGIVSWNVGYDVLMGEQRSKLALEAAATDDPDAPFFPGESQCKYCPHKGACTALLNQTMQASGISFKNLDVAQQAADKEPTEMTDDQIREIIEAAPLIRQMIEGVEKEALRRLEAGHSIAGIKLVHGRGSRDWAIEDDNLMAEKLKRMGLPKGVIWQTKLISVAQVEKAKWTKRDGSVDQLSPRQMKTLQSEYIKKSAGKLTVVPESDEREAVVKDASPLFDAVETLPSWLM
jgi:hypothetical protein